MQNVIRLFTCIALLLNGTLAPAQFAGVGYRLMSPPTSKVSPTGNTCGNSGNTGLLHIACTTATVTAGQTILFDVSEFNYVGKPTPTIVDSQGNVATHLLGPTTYDGNGTDDVWVIKNASAGVHTITASYGSAENFESILAIVLQGSSTTSPVDSSSAGAVIGTNCPTVNASNIADLLISFENVSGPTMAPGALPQRMLLGMQEGTSMVAYGTNLRAGTNFVEWLNGGSAQFSCDTIALH